MNDMGWQVSLIFTIGGLLIFGGLIAFIGGLIHDEKSRQRILRGPAPDSRDSIRTFRNATRQR